MKLGVYDAILHDQPLPEALRTVRALGLTGIEINAGGFLPPVHLPVDDILAGTTAAEDYLGAFAEAGVELTALNVNGNPLHPDPPHRPGPRARPAADHRGRRPPGRGARRHHVRPPCRGAGRHRARLEPDAVRVHLLRRP